jgi:hypothetical protein
VKYETKEDLAAKVDWEGGLAETIFGYGISADELPENTPPRIVRCWTAVEQVSGDLNEIDNWLFP